MSQAILLKDVDGLGEAGAVVDVSPGYLRNYLGPRKLAQPATAASIAAARERLERAEREARDQEERSQETAALLSKTVLTISHQAGDDGRLFGSVTAKEIVDAVRQARGLKLDKRKVRLAEPIRALGTHMIEVEVTPDVTATIKTMVVAED
ncbi:MAG: 50S ribosomal protein L9 [Solirubrobacterales bacterium]